MNKKKVIGLVVAAALVAGGALAFKHFNRDDGLKLYGSVDMRTVDLAIEESGRLAEVLVYEGATVKAGEVIARLDDRRQRLAFEKSQNQVAIAQAQLALLEAGARTEQIDVARANLKAAQEALALSDRNCKREKQLGSATSAQQRDQICSQAKVDAAQKEAAQKQLDLLLAGTRAEEITISKANLAAAQTAMADAKRALDNCALVAPSNGVIRTRLKEPGDMVTSNAPVFELALMDPLWVRAWVDEVNLSRIKMGDKVNVYSDSFPNAPFMGTVGFISTVAEFTPKTVQTESLRTSLVYEVRLTVEDPDGKLRLGMPVTVQVAE